MKKYEVYKKTYKILLEKEASNSLKNCNNFIDINDMRNSYSYKYVEDFQNKKEALQEFKKTFENSEVEYDMEWNDSKCRYDKYIYLTKFFLVETQGNEIIRILTDSFLLSSQINNLDTEWLKIVILYKEFMLEDFKKVLKKEKWEIFNNIPKNVSSTGSIMVVKAKSNYGFCHIEIFYKKVDKGILLTVNKIYDV